MGLPGLVFCWQLARALRAQDGTSRTGVQSEGRLEFPFFLEAVLQVVYFRGFAHFIQVI